MKKEIKLVCFWCGKENGLLAEVSDEQNLLEEDKYVVDYEPCKECMEKWSKGAANIIEVLDHPISNFDLPIKKEEEASYYPTGRYAIVEKEWLLRFLKEPILSAAIQNKYMFVGPDIFNMLFHQEIENEKDILDDFLEEGKNETL